MSCSTIAWISRTVVAAFALVTGIAFTDAALAQEKRGHCFPHWRLGDGFLVAALMERLTRGIDANGAEVVVNPLGHPCRTD